MIFEHAYALHRMGENEQASDKLKELNGNEEITSSIPYKYLLGQVQYKLTNYSKTIQLYD